MQGACVQHDDHADEDETFDTREQMQSEAGEQVPPAGAPEAAEALASVAASEPVQPEQPAEAPETPETPETLPLIDPTDETDGANTQAPIAPMTEAETPAPTLVNEADGADKAIPPALTSGSLLDGYQIVQVLNAAPGAARYLATLAPQRNGSAASAESAETPQDSSPTEEWFIIIEQAGD